MARARSGIVRHKRVKKVLKQAKGHYGRRSKIYRTANTSVMKALSNAYRDRRRKKREFRRLWITKINAATRAQGLPYNRFMQGLKNANIEINRKILSELAVNNKEAFTELVELAKKNI